MRKHIKKIGVPQFVETALYDLAPPQNVSTTKIPSKLKTESNAVLIPKEKQTAVVDYEIVQKLIQFGIAEDVARNLARNKSECELQLNKLITRSEKPKNSAAYLRCAIEKKYVHTDVKNKSHINRYEPINIPPPPPPASETTRNACLQQLSKLRNEFLDTRH